MQKNFFEDFVDWIREESDYELWQSSKFNEITRRKYEISDKIIEGLGGDETLLEKYSDLAADINIRCEYFMCRKVAEAIIRIIADIGLIGG